MGDKPLEIKLGYWKNNKTNWIYDVMGTVLNATNGEQDGKVMVLYKNKNGRHFVRNIGEFKEKFTYYGM